MGDSGFVSIRTARLQLEDGRHPLEGEAACAIDAGWQKRLAAKPRMHDGETVLATGASIAEGVLSAAVRRIRYAGLMHFLSLGAQEAAAMPYRHVFAWPAIISADGKAVMGRMAPHTANAGRIYFPAGSLEPADFAAGIADLEAGMARELREETGLDLAHAAGDPQFWMWQEGGLIALIKTFRFAQSARELAAAARAHLALGGDDELDAILVFGPGESDPAMTPLAARFMRAFRG